jgi:hypothetical protein
MAGHSAVKENRKIAAAVPKSRMGEKRESVQEKKLG